MTENTLLEARQAAEAVLDGDSEPLPAEAPAEPVVEEPTRAREVHLLISC